MLKREEAPRRSEGSRPGGNPNTPETSRKMPASVEIGESEHRVKIAAAPGKDEFNVTLPSTLKALFQ